MKRERGRRPALARNRESENGYIRLQDRWLELADGAVTAYDLWLPNPRKFPGPRPFIIRMHGNGRDGTYSGHDAEALKWVDTYGIGVMLPDFRGQGRHINRYRVGGSPALWSVTQLSDINEFIKLVKSLPDCDGTVGLFGNSQGGLAAAMGAAWSGQAFPEYAYAQGWYNRQDKFETVAAACSINWSCDPSEALIHGGNMIGAKFEEALMTPQPTSWQLNKRGTAQGTRWDRYGSVFTKLIRSGNAAALKAYLDDAASNHGGVPDTLSAKLAATTVPCLFRWAIDDVWRPWQTSFSDLLAMGSNAFVSLSPGGHNSTYSSKESTWHTNQYNAFFEYHLLGTNDNSDLSVFGGTDWSDKHEMRMAVWPQSEADRASDSYVWPYKWVGDKSNFSGFSTTPLYVRASGTLQLTAETNPSATSDITQNWNDTSFGSDDWVNAIESWQAGDGDSIGTVLLGGATPKLVPGEANVRLAAQGTDYVIAGTPTANVFVESDKSEFIVEVALIDYGGGSDEVFITHGFKKVTGYSPGVTEVEVTLGPCCYEVVGTRQIQVRISTYPVDQHYRSGEDYYLYTRPIFGTDGEVTLTVHHNSTNQTRVNLPLFADNVSVLDA